MSGTTKKFHALVLVSLLLFAAVACHRQTSSVGSNEAAVPPRPVFKPLPPNAPPQLRQLIDGAVVQAGVTKGYNPAYVSIAYPDGDVPLETGVCSDVVVRAFRKVGIDLQKEVHEDMARAWSEYPRKWGASRPDTNIDHRRVLNLMTYFKRQGKGLPISSNADDYQPGDVIAWDLGGGLDHIGIVTQMWSESEKRCLIVHNIGAGTRVEDVMFAWTIKGHYRYFK